MANGYRETRQKDAPQEMSGGQLRRTYCVWRNDDKDTLIMLDGTADNCADAMGITRQAFYAYLSRPVKEWTIIKSERIK